MKRQRTDKADRRAGPSRPCRRFNTPFARLADMLSQARGEMRIRRAEAQPGRKRDAGCVSGTKGSDAEGCLFREAMAGVEPLRCSRVRPRAPGPLSPPSRRPLLEGELEAYARLVDLVGGEGCFDIQYTDEYIEGAIVGADPGLLTKLRRGDFSLQAHLDLHGMTAEEAHHHVERFIIASVIKGLRCVLIIHGRGINSRGQIPILKQRISCWLKRGRLKRLVLAFATARPCDGGAGALYVLLRKRLPERR